MQLSVSCCALANGANSANSARNTSSAHTAHLLATAGTLTANDELLNEFEEELQRHASDLDRTGNPAKRARLAAADASVNVAAENYDGFSEGYGLRHQPGAENARVRAAGAQAADIAAELNQHASVVLAGRAAQGAGAGKGGSGVEGSGAEGRNAAEARSRSELSDLRQVQVGVGFFSLLLFFFGTLHA